MLPHSGKAVVCGENERNNQWVIRVFSPSDGKLEKTKEIKAPDQEWPNDCLGVVVEGTEYLAMVSGPGGSVKLINLASGKVHLAYDVYENREKRSAHQPVAICLGDSKRVWLCLFEGEVVELDCSGLKFTPTGRKFHLKRRDCFGLCYLPARDALVATYPRSDLFLCVSCESGEKLWEMNWKENGKGIYPRKAIFSHQHQVLVVTDITNSRIQIFEGEDGSHVQSVALPGDVGEPEDMCLHNQLLLMYSYSRAQNVHKVSGFSLN